MVVSTLTILKQDETNRGNRGKSKEMKEEEKKEKMTRHDTMYY